MRKKYDIMILVVLNCEEVITTKYLLGSEALTDLNSTFNIS